MMQSRTTSLPEQNLTAGQIDNECEMAASLGVTHIPICVAMDYPAYMKLWIDGVRRTGKKVWYRGIWNRWTGEYSQPDDMTPQQYLDQTAAFIRAYPGLFRPGDIFDACPEPAGGHYWADTYGASWNWSPAPPNTATIAYNLFLRNMKTMLEAAFGVIGLRGVRTDVNSQLPFELLFPGIMEQATIDAWGMITVDSYPEGSEESPPIITDPAVAAALRVAEYEAIHAAWPDAPILIGEMGYQISSVTPSEALQEAILRAELDAIATLLYIIGLNGWHGSGLEGWNGARLYNGDRDGWTPRLAANAVADYFTVKSPVSEQVFTKTKIADGWRITVV